VNGLSQAAGMAIDMTAAQLASTTFQSGSGSDLLWARAFDGNDWGAWTSFTVRPESEIVGTEGNDVLTGTAGDDTIQALGGDDVLRGGPGADSLDGGPGRDILYVDNSDKAITGGADFDIVYGDASTVQNGFSFVLTGKNVEAVYGNDGNDVIDASALSDYQTMLFGANGDDVLIAGTNGSYTLNGGEGSDTVVIPGNRNDYMVDPNPAGWPGWMTVKDTAGTMTYWLQQVERLQFKDAIIDAPQLPVNQEGTSAADIITAGNGGEVLYGLDGNDRLVGGAGDDSLIGGLGSDQLIGGNGNDDLFIDNNDTLVDGGEGWDTVYVDDTQGAPAALHLTLAGTNVEFVYGGMGNDVFDASGVSTGIEMWGQWADDVLIGGSGDDTLLGDEWLIGGGNDILDGGAGNDWLDGGNGSDTFVFRAGCGLDTLYDFDQTQDATGTMVMAPEDHDVIRFEGGLFANFDALVASGAMAQVGANVVITLDATDQITLRNMSIGNLDAGDFVFAVTVNGTAGDDVITGDARAESINGLAGNDQINGGAGDDWLSGGDGNDILTGGPGADQLIGGPGTDFLWIDAQDTLIDGGDGLDYLYLDYTQPGQHFTVAGTHVEVVSGTLYDDVIDASGVTYGTVLFGNYGNDVLTGGAGNDSLQAAPGDDILDGGDGVDTAIYTGARSDYRITQRSDGSLLIADNRTGSPDGTDTVSNVEVFQFADKSYSPLDLLNTAVGANASVTNAGGTVGGTASATDPISIGAGETVEISSAFSGSVMFTAGTGTLRLDDPSSFSGTVAGMADQDTIDFANIPFAGNTTGAYSSAGGHADRQRGLPQG
jgi:Ca2+-binding RTX toxin-like protein